MKKLKILNSVNTKIDFQGLKINSNWQSLLLNFLQISNIIQTIENPQLTKFGQFVVNLTKDAESDNSYLRLAKEILGLDLDLELGPGPLVQVPSLFQPAAR